MLLSLIIPIYNVADYLDECLLSIIPQLREGVEVILIDDGSTDDSYQIAKNYADKLPMYLHLYQQANQGVSAARNVGLSHATGRYVWFIDSDDWIEVGAIDELLREILLDEEDILHFKLAYAMPDGRQVPQNYQLKDCLPGGMHYRYTLMMHDFNVTSKLYRRQFLLDLALPFPEDVYYEDIVAVLYLLKANSLREIDRVFYDYRQRPDSIIHQSEDPKQLDILTVIRKLQQIAQHYPDLLFHLEALQTRFDYSLAYVIRVCGNHPQAQILKAQRTAESQVLHQRVKKVKNPYLQALV